MPKSSSDPSTSARRGRKTKQSRPANDVYEEYDSPWKEIIEHLFPQLMHFFFPTIATVIDWSRPAEFLDKELQRIAPRSKSGKQTVDKLVKVWRIDGSELWFLIHIEVQSQKDGGFPLRMYIYHYRIFDKYKQRAVSVAILGDDDPQWRPSQYEDQLLGCEVNMKFPIAKLLDYEANWQELEHNPNPFAIVVMAHLKAMATQNKEQDRLFWKKTLIRDLYKRNYSRQEVFNIFRFLDWVMKLPDALELQIQIMIGEYEEAHQMQYVTSIERIALDRGHQEGLKEGHQEGLKEGHQEGLREGRNQVLQETIIELLDHRFQLPDEEKDSLLTLLKPISEESLLKKVINLTMDAESIADFTEKFQSLRKVTATTAAQVASE